MGIRTPGLFRAREALFQLSYGPRCRSGELRACVRCSRGSVQRRPAPDHHPSHQRVTGGLSAASTRPSSPCTSGSGLFELHPRWCKPRTRPTSCSGAPSFLYPARRAGQRRSVENTSRFGLAGLDPATSRHSRLRCQLRHSPTSRLNPAHVSSYDARRSSVGAGVVCLRMPSIQRDDPSRVCGASRDRTGDLDTASVALYQLSYSPKCRHRCLWVGRPARDRTGVTLLSKVHYHCATNPQCEVVSARRARTALWRRWDSNPRPSACKAVALPTELHPLAVKTTVPDPGRSAVTCT